MKKYNGTEWVDTTLRQYKTSTDTFTTLPADIYADGTNATVGISGNTVQNGTPTPDNPIMPEGCGDLETVGAKAGQYKIPISSNSTTTPVYLGEVESTRRIKKLVLDGTENWFLSTAQAGRFGLSLSDYLKSNGTITSFCSHYMAIAQKSGGTVPNNSQYFYSGSDAARYLFIVDTNCSTAADFKSYLAQQYAAGTPVTVWYVLAEPETGIVNEPLRKIGSYADTVSGITIPTITGADSFDVLTTLKPSEVSLSYTGWHDASVKEWDGSQWD